MSWSPSELRVRLARRETGLSPKVKYFNWPFKGGTSFVDHLCYLCLVFLSWSTSELRLKLARCETGLSPPVNIFTDRSKAVLLLWIIYVITVLFLSCFRARLYIDALWSPGGRGQTFSGVWFWSCHFSIGILGEVFDCMDAWSLIFFLLLLPLLIYYYQNKMHAHKH